MQSDTLLAGLIPVIGNGGVSVRLLHGEVSVYRRFECESKGLTQDA